MLAGTTLVPVRNKCHNFLTEKILRFIVRILWHRVGTTLEPRFSHRENFAIYCENLVAPGEP